MIQFNDDDVKQRMLWMANGRIMPTVTEWDAQDNRPASSTTIRRRWGMTWAQIAWSLGLKCKSSEIDLDYAKIDIIQKYVSGIGTCTLGKRYGVSHITIRGRLMQWGVKMRDRKDGTMGGNVGLKMRRHKNSIISAYRDGASTTQIGLYYHVAGHTVARYLKQWGVQVRETNAPRRTDIDEEQQAIIQMYRSGYSTRQIAKRFSTTHTLISTRLREWGERRVEREKSSMVNSDFLQR